MAFFISEKETEEYLERETRDIPMPDGSTRPFTTTRLAWRSLDYILEWGWFTQERVVELAIINAEEVGLSFEDSFNDTLAYIHAEMRKTQGVD